MTLPSSIEAHLREAGFTQTELHILRCCLDGTPHSLREIAGKTKKSTGVLDQAMKKLMRRKIMVRKQMNGVPKYALASMDAVLHWIEADVKQKTAGLLRRQQDFTSFVRTLQQHEAKPKVEYFEGEKGIARAYEQLLADKPAELLQFLPLDCHEDEHAFGEIRARFNRQRRKLGINLRVIAHNTIYGKRFRDRDALEKRTTKLVPPGRCAIDYEKIIAGHTVACFNYVEKTAYFIHFPELAKGEINMFEMVWGMDRFNESGESVQALVKTPSAEAASLKNLFSAKSLKLFSFAAATAAVATFLLYLNNTSLNEQRIRDKITSVAATAAPQIAAADANEIHSMEDVNKPAYTRLVLQMDEIRRQNDQIVYIYLIRSTEHSGIYEFVADADAINPFAEVDTNGDGLITEADQLGLPGLSYDVSQMDALMQGEVTHPIANSGFYTDAWGSVYTAYAPVKNEDGSVAAVLAVDMWASKVQELTRNDFNPIIYFLGIFLMILILYIGVFDRGILVDLKNILHLKKVLFGISATTIIALLITAGMYKYTLELMKDEVGTRLMSIVATAAPEIDAEDLMGLNAARDMKTDRYQRVFKKLNEIRNNNENIMYVYVMKPADNGMYQFLADADSNYYLPSSTDTDPIEVIPPGTYYDSYFFGEKHKRYALEKPIYENNFVTDKWGTYISASAPVLTNADEAIAFLGVDMNVDHLYDQVNNSFKPWIWFFAIAGIILSLSLLYHYFLSYKPTNSS